MSRCTARQRKCQKNTIGLHCWISHSRAILNGIHVAVGYNVTTRKLTIQSQNTSGETHVSNSTNSNAVEAMSIHSENVSNIPVSSSVNIESSVQSSTFDTNNGSFVIPNINLIPSHSSILANGSALLDGSFNNSIPINNSLHVQSNTSADGSVSLNGSVINSMPFYNSMHFQSSTLANGHVCVGGFINSSRQTQSSALVNNPVSFVWSNNNSMPTCIQSKTMTSISASNFGGYISSTPPSNIVANNSVPIQSLMGERNPLQLSSIGSPLSYGLSNRSRIRL